MDGPLFRQKSLNKITSPEELHDYIRVTSPRLWMVLAAVAILLVGFIVYASTATIENTVQVKITIFNIEAADGNDYQTTTLADAAIPAYCADAVRPGMTVRLGDKVGVIETTYSDDAIGGTHATLRFDESYLGLEDGEYDGELVLETTTPMNFLWN